MRADIRSTGTYQSVRELRLTLKCATLCLQGWKRERVVREFDEGSRVIVVLPDDKFSTKKVSRRHRESS